MSSHGKISLMTHEEHCKSKLWLKRGMSIIWWTIEVMNHQNLLLSFHFFNTCTWSRIQKTNNFPSAVFIRCLEIYVMLSWNYLHKYGSFMLGVSSCWLNCNKVVLQYEWWTKGYFENVDKVVVIYNTWQGLKPSIILLTDMYKLQEIWFTEPTRLFLKRKWACNGSSASSSRSAFHRLTRPCNTLTSASLSNIGGISYIAFLFKRLFFT